MRRERIDFETFRTHFISQPDGFFPVYAAFDEDYAGDNLRVVKLDMICEWRLDDGKVKFVEVPFEDEHQLDQIIAYLITAQYMLNKAILKRIGELKFADTKPESERIPYPPSSIPTLSDEVMERIRKDTMGYEMSLIAQALREQVAFSETPDAEASIE